MATFHQTLRLFFAIFSLYLLGDAFYRWDGFRYYASFYEFLPSAGLAAILWSIVALVVAATVWFPLKIMEWIFRSAKINIRIEQMFVFLCVLLLLSLFLQFGNILKVPLLSRVLQWNLLSLVVIVIAALLFTWLFRNKAESWTYTLQDMITPLVWIFSFFILVSVPLVAYKTFTKATNRIVVTESAAFEVSNENRPNILLVTFDALTARNMSVYGYQIPTTPFITEWAKTASLFTNVKASSHITTPTTASLMTGKRLWTHQTYHIAGSSKPVNSEIENMPLLLRNKGYYNMAFVVNPFASVRKLGIVGGFDIAPLETGFSKQANLFGMVEGVLYRFFGNKIQLYNWLVQRDFILFKVINKLSRNISKTTAPPEKAFKEFLSVMDSNHSRPFFAWIHLYPPHDPYLPPDPFMGRVDSSKSLRTYKSQEDAVYVVDRHHDQYDQFPPQAAPIVDILRSRYDEFIMYCDNQLDLFIAELLKNDLLKNTVVIVSADHGESFEHNYIKHSHNNLYEQITHIPLIIKMPGQSQGRVIVDLTEQIDISATILDVADIPLPSWMEGRSLLPLMRGERLPSKPAFSMALEGQASRGHTITNGKIAVWEGDYKLIHQLEEEKSLLFNLKTDQGERNNLFYREHDTGQKLLSLINMNLQKANERIIKGQ